MSEAMDYGEFWLPSEFLPEDFFLEGETKSSKGERRSTGDDRVFSPCEFPYGFGSNVSSPDESATETESDEEDYLAGLTRQMAQAFLKEDDDSSVPAPKAMAGSPQSTLCDLRSWYGSNKGSPNGPSLVSSPSSTPLDQPKDDAWDLLTAAAGQVVRLRLSEPGEQSQKFHGRGLLGPPAKPSLPVPVSVKNPGNAGFYTNPLIIQQQQQLQIQRFYQLKQQQLMKQQLSAAWGRQQSRGKVGGGYGEGRCGRTLGLPSSAWPPLQRQHQHQQHQSQPQPQPQPGSGMRAVFLSGSGARRESAGTGVFLPRRPGNPTELRKKPACSTVLLPDRVIQALNLNLDDMGVHPRIPGGFLLDQDAMMDRGNTLVAPNKKRNHYRPPPPTAVTSHEVQLPAEWTY